jgi:hypothetical protein
MDQLQGADCPSSPAIPRAQAMLRYAIVLSVVMVTTAAFPAPVVHPATSNQMSTADAINACRAELGKHAKYLQVKKCVTEKKITTVQAVKACRAELGKHAKYLVVRKCVLQKKNGGGS